MALLGANLGYVDIRRMEFLVPRHGTFLVIELDAVQTVKPLKDPLLTVAAAHMRPQKYVGYIHQVHTCLDFERNQFDSACVSVDRGATHARKTRS